jgi:hypothetical protein
LIQTSPKKSKIKFPQTMALSLKMHRVLHHAEDGIERAQKTQRERERERE